MKILALSDIVIPFIYSPMVRTRFNGVDLVIDCGDLPYYYLDYVTNQLNVPGFYVKGNHAKEFEIYDDGFLTGPQGAVDLHGQLTNYRGLLLAGIEGSGRYHPGPYQYSQFEMWVLVARLLPGMIRNRLLHGRFLDVFVSHAPPWGVHDQPDLPHQGIKAFLWLDRVFKPILHLHGHVHVYRPDMVVETVYHSTRVVNTFGFREIEVPVLRSTAN